MAGTFKGNECGFECLFIFSGNCCAVGFSNNITKPKPTSQFLRTVAISVYDSVGTAIFNLILCQTSCIACILRDNVTSKRHLRIIKRNKLISGSVCSSRCCTWDVHVFPLDLERKFHENGYIVGVLLLTVFVYENKWHFTHMPAILGYQSAVSTYGKHKVEPPLLYTAFPPVIHDRRTHNWHCGPYHHSSLRYAIFVHLEPKSSSSWWPCLQQHQLQLPWSRTQRILVVCPETSVTTNLRWVTSQKNTELIYIAREVCSVACVWPELCRCAVQSVLLYIGRLEDVQNTYLWLGIP